MLFLLLGAILLAPVPVSDTTISFGVIKRDLTGDGIPETLSLVGTGPTLRSLRVTFTIQSADHTLFSDTWPLIRPPDGRQTTSDAQLRTRIKTYGASFFNASKFRSPTAFLADLQQSARRHIALIPSVIARDLASADTSRARVIWEQMRSSPIVIFEFSSGGDAVTALGWSSSDNRFYHLFECC